MICATLVNIQTDSQTAFEQLSQMRQKQDQHNAATYLPNLYCYNKTFFLKRNKQNVPINHNKITLLQVKSNS